MTTLPRKPARGEAIRAELIGQIIDYMREITPVQGRNIRISTTPGGSVISGQPGGGAAASGTAPWTCRFHRTDDDPDGKWEIWLPYGCMSCGSTLETGNKPMSEVAGHESDKPGWYLLPLDETEGTADDSGTRQFDVVAHAKTSAKMYGVDGLDDPSRRLLYVDAKKILSSAESAAATSAQLADGKWGDEFSQAVASVSITQAESEGETQTTRKITPIYESPISVAGRVSSNFDLVWYFSFADDGSFEVSKVYCVRNGTAVAGINAVGPTMVDVSGAENAIYARVDTNAAAGQAIDGENVVAVVVDPDSTPADQYVTWLKLYDISNNLVAADYRASSLVNVQALR